MQGKVDKVEAKTSQKTGKSYYSVTINGVQGNSFDDNFVGTEGTIVNYESETSGKFTNYKFIKGEGAKSSSSNNSTPPPPAPPKPVTAGEIKLLFIPKALECAINAAKLTCKDGTITSEQIMKVAKVYLTWMINEGLGEEANG